MNTENTAEVLLRNLLLFRILSRVLLLEGLGIALK